MRGTILGLPIIRILVYWGLYWGPPYLEKLPYLPMYTCLLQLQAPWATSATLQASVREAVARPGLSRVISGLVLQGHKGFRVI